VALKRLGGKRRAVGGSRRDAKKRRREGRRRVAYRIRGVFNKGLEPLVFRVCRPYRNGASTRPRGVAATQKNAGVKAGVGARTGRKGSSTRGSSPLSSESAAPTGTAPRRARGESARRKKRRRKTSAPKFGGRKVTAVPFLPYRCNGGLSRCRGRKRAPGARSGGRPRFGRANIGRGPGGGRRLRGRRGRHRSWDTRSR
jgi:hypothetical protein